MMDKLSTILCSRVRAKLLTLLCGWELREIHLRELARKSGFALRTVQQDLEKLLKTELIRARRDGNRLYFIGNADHPAFPDIQNLVLKTSGLIPLLADALSREKKIRCAFIFGSFASGEERGKSDVDLLVIGDIGLRRVSAILTRIEAKIAREVNPHVLTWRDFQQRRQTADHFVQRLLESPKLFVVGSSRDLETME